MDNKNNQTPKNIKAIIGLGNPGGQYARTRHNIGFRVVDALAEKYNGIWQEKSEMATATITVGDHSIILIKPLTYMNNSGRVIPSLAKKGITPENILVVHDELEHPFGKITSKIGGSARGHNGLKSIIATCGENFYRVRCGISRPENKDNVADYVLSSFAQSPTEIENFIALAVREVEKIIA